ncbi:MAG: phosphoglucosamine mutase [Nanoarchaeota archaeon]|nr:phosphoglucosamine mutase [Nanoarchaeota archaeon]
MSLFGTSGIRGVYGESITKQLARDIGKALGTYAKSETIIVGMDPRLSGPLLKKALISSILRYKNVVDLNMAPTPVVAFGCKTSSKEGVIITASHNPKEYNGFKILGPDGLAYSRKKEIDIETIITNKKYNPGLSQGELIEKSIEKGYMSAILERIKLRGRGKILIDPGNGAASRISPTLLKRYGYKVEEINCDPDGSFPNRNPEPNEENLKETAKLVKERGCDIGFCHDGDADRMMAIDDEGKVADFDKFLIFLCKGAAHQKTNKTVVTTVDASMAVEDHLNELKVVRSRVGDVFVANDVKYYNACFGGEPSGSYIFPEFGLWPDGIYAIFKTLQALEAEGKKLSQILSEIPKYPMRRIKLKCPNEKKEVVMKKIKIPEGCEVITKDGILMKTEDTQILIRPSGTEEYIRINVEAKEESILKEKLSYWKEEIERLIASS